MRKSLPTARTRIDTPANTPPVNWRPWVTPMWRIIPRENRGGWKLDFQWRRLLKQSSPPVFLFFFCGSKNREARIRSDHCPEELRPGIGLLNSPAGKKGSLPTRKEPALFAAGGRVRPRSGRLPGSTVVLRRSRRYEPGPSSGVARRTRAPLRSHRKRWRPGTRPSSPCSAW